MYLVAQLCLTLWDPMDLAYQTPFSRESSPPRDQTPVSCIGRQILYHLSHRVAQIQNYMCVNLESKIQSHYFLWFLSSQLGFTYCVEGELFFFFFPHVSTSWFTGKNAVSTLFVGYRNARWQAFPQCLWCVLIISCHTKCIYNMDFKNWPQDMGVLHRKLNRTAWLLNLKYSFICSFICSIIQKKHSCRHCTKRASWTLPSESTQSASGIPWKSQCVAGVGAGVLNSFSNNREKRVSNYLRSSLSVWQYWDIA